MNHSEFYYDDIIAQRNYSEKRIQANFCWKLLVKLLTLLITLMNIGRKYYRHKHFISLYKPSKIQPQVYITALDQSSNVFS